MRNLLLLISLLFLYNSCQTGSVVNTSTNTVEGFSFFVLNEGEEDKIKKALQKREEILGGKCFSDFIIGRDLIQTQDLSNVEVVERLRLPVGAEFETYYKRFSRVFGYTYPNTPRIYINRKYFGGASICDVASNLAHELSHKQGFEHDFKATLLRPFSIPYSINAAFEQCCK